MALAPPRGEPVRKAGDAPPGGWMFCIKNDKVILAPPEVKGSHLDWFRHERWIADDDPRDEKFFAHVIMGIYFPREHRIHCFREIDFSLDRDAMEIVNRNLNHLQKTFDLPPETEIFLGPRDTGRSMGTLAMLLKKLRKSSAGFP